LKNNSSVVGNHCRLDGGGVFNNSKVTMQDDSKLRENVADTWGGGGIDNDGGTFVMNGHSKVVRNTSNRAGGVDNWHGTFTMNGHSSVSFNSAWESGGGGVQNDQGATLILNDDSSISQNKAPTGGGVYIAAGTAVFKINGRSAVSNNSGGDITRKQDPQ